MRTQPTKKVAFDAEAGLRAARGFHLAAGLLETAHQQNVRSVRKGVNVGVDHITQLVGVSSGAAVLEALALEIILKVRLSRAGMAVPRSHDHANLFGKLPAADKKDSEQRYNASRHPAMVATIEDALNYSCDVFEKWRYMHEYSQVDVSMGEMRRAFTALADDL
jgi:hypothetical protein